MKLKVLSRPLLCINDKFERRKILSIYSSKIAELLSVVRSLKIDLDGYKDLPNLKDKITPDKKMDEIVPYLVRAIDKDKLGLVISTSPVIQLMPYDYRIYILACLGLRSFHIEN